MLIKYSTCFSKNKKLKLNILFETSKMNKLKSIGAVFKKNIPIIGRSLDATTSTVVGQYIYKKYSTKNNEKHAKISKNDFFEQVNKPASASEEKRDLYVAAFKEFQYRTTSLYYLQSKKALAILKDTPNIDKNQLKLMLFRDPEYCNWTDSIFARNLEKYNITPQEWVNLYQIFKTDLKIIETLKEIQQLGNDAANGKFSYEIIMPKSMTEKKYWLLFELKAIDQAASKLDFEIFTIEKGYTSIGFISISHGNEGHEAYKKKNIQIDEIDALNTNHYPGEVVFLEYGRRLQAENQEAVNLKNDNIMANLSSLVLLAGETASGKKEALQKLKKRTAEIQKELANL